MDLPQFNSRVQFKELALFYGDTTTKKIAIECNIKEKGLIGSICNSCAFNRARIKVIAQNFHSIFAWFSPALG